MGWGDLALTASLEHYRSISGVIEKIDTSHLQVSIVYCPLKRIPGAGSGLRIQKGRIADRTLVGTLRSAASSNCPSSLGGNWIEAGDHRQFWV